MLNPYPAYKQTDIPWLPKMPEHWEFLPNFALFEERNEKGFQDEELLSVTIKQGVIKQTALEIKKDNSNEDKSNYKLVKKGDLPYNKMRMWQGAVGLSDYNGIVSPAYIVLKTRDRLNSKFFHYLFRTPTYTTYSYQNSYGIVLDQLSCRYEDFKRMYSPVPPLHEQTAIANFLDARISQIDTFIANKEKIIELLKERIYSLVLLGHYNKSASVSENWLNEIPDTWRVEKTKFLFNEISIKNCPKAPLLAVTQDKGVLPKDMCESNFVTSSGDLSGLRFVDSGDFVISLRSFQGGIEFSNYSGIVSPAYSVFRLKPHLNNELKRWYFKYLFKSPRFIALLNTIISGIRDGKNINYADFAELKLPVPPDKEIEKMMKHFKLFETFKASVEREKLILQEYKTALIAEAVTGKIKVV